MSQPGEPNTTLRSLERLILANPTSYEIRCRYAEACRAVGRRSAAVSAYRVAVVLMLEKGHTRRAIQTLRRALALVPGALELEDALSSLLGDPDASGTTQPLGLDEQPTLRIEVPDGLPDPEHV